MMEEHKYTTIGLEHLYALLTEIEETFTVYLTLRQYQWASAATRSAFMKQLVNTTDLHLLKEHLRSLQESFLFAEHLHESKGGDEEEWTEVARG